MYIGKLVFSQIIEHLPMHTFQRCVQRYRSNRKIKRFLKFPPFFAQVVKL
jgi:hypothetical protein